MTNLSETKDASIYNEIVRLEFAQEAKTCLFSYFTVNEKSRYSAEKALSFCESDKEELSYLNNILILIKNSVSPEKFETQSVNDEEKGKFNDPLEEFVQKLELKQLEQYRPLKNEEIKKFYEFANEFAEPGFTWPLTSEISERRDIYNYITDPYHLYTEGQGKELAINRLAYRRLVESGSLDSSKGDYVRIEHGKLMSYEREISIEECKDLTEKNPGLLYAPIKQQSVVIRFTSIANVQLKEWQVSIRLRRKNDPNDVAIMNNTDNDLIKNQNFRLILDSGSTMTIIPFFIRKGMVKDHGWSGIPSSTSVYGQNTGIYQVLTPWEVSLGDGTNWTKWIETSNLYCWQENAPNDIDCGLVGFDILNSIHQIKMPGEPYVFITENNVISQLQKIYNNL